MTPTHFAPLPGRSRRGRRPALAAACLALVLPGALQGQDRAAEALRAASDTYGGLTTICADFHQVLTVTLLRQVKEARGELCQRRPNLFFMRFSEPGGDEVVADGEWFWVYYASVNPDQVVRLPLDPARGGLDFYREFLERPGERYHAVLEGEEEVTGRATLRIALTPRQARGYESARVWIDPGRGMIRRVEVAEENGTVRRVTLDRIRVDPVLPADAFTYRVPDGVRVVSR
ncbi:MAG: outer membrane lipoprotein carrier protein LolA [Longimicrobiales bacterium]|nr:outer membrane lipoprotein carrier protein LolA [Longimicrobiales bacterium]